MALDNLISVVLPDDFGAKVKTAIDSVVRMVSGWVVNLSPEERRQYGSISDSNKAFVQKCKEYMDLNPDTLPPGWNMEEFERDYQARKALEEPLRALQRLTERIEDTKTLLDYDNYTAALMYYRYVKFLASTNEPGTTSIYKDLGKHFARTKKTAGETPPPETPAPPAEG